MYTVSTSPVCWFPGLAVPVLKKITAEPKILTHDKAEVLVVLRW